jgi:hypothetical protein
MIVWGPEPTPLVLRRVVKGLEAVNRTQGPLRKALEDFYKLSGVER